MATATEQALKFPVYLILGFIITLLFEFPINLVLEGITKKNPILTPKNVDTEQWDKLMKIRGELGGKWLARLERILFFIGIWIAAYELIGVWLVLKVASKWEVWTNIFKVPDKLDGIDDLDYFIARTQWGTRTYQRFLLGTLLNLFAAIVGVAIFDLLIRLQPSVISFR